MNYNTRLERLGMWLAARLWPQEVASPTLACEGRRPTLRWVRTGDSVDAASRGARDVLRR